MNRKPLNQHNLCRNQHNFYRNVRIWSEKCKSHDSHMTACKPHMHIHTYIQMHAPRVSGRKVRKLSAKYRSVKCWRSPIVSGSSISLFSERSSTLRCCKWEIPCIQQTDRQEQVPHRTYIYACAYIYVRTYVCMYIHTQRGLWDYELIHLCTYKDIYTQYIHTILCRYSHMYIDRYMKYTCTYYIDNDQLLLQPQTNSGATDIVRLQKKPSWQFEIVLTSTVSQTRGGLHQTVPPGVPVRRLRPPPTPSNSQ